MLPIRGLYEIAIRVRDLAKSEPFTGTCSGLELACETSDAGGCS